MRTQSLQAFNAEVVRFAATLARSDAATIVALSGELGAGKTTFTQALARYFGIEETVTSPTFVIQKTYPMRDASRSNGAGDTGFKKMIHIDAYRLKSAHELEVLGWKEIASDAGNLIVIEWPERVAGLIPDSAHRITLEFIDEDTRNISYDR